MRNTEGRASFLRRSRTFYGVLPKKPGSYRTRINQAMPFGGKRNRATPTGVWKKSVQSSNWTDTGKIDEHDNACSVKYDFPNGSSRVSFNLQEGGQVKRWKQVFYINSLPVEFKLDTRSDVNCVPLSIVNHIGGLIGLFDDGPVFDYSCNRINILTEKHN